MQKSGIVYIDPQPKLRPRFSKHGTYKHPKTKAYEIELQYLVKALGNMNLMLDCPIAFKVDFYLARPKSVSKKRLIHSTKPDLDNLAKAFFDACEGIIYTNDSRIYSKILTKQYTDLKPRIEFEFSTV